MAAFSDIEVSGFRYLSVDVINEIIISLNERLSPSNTEDLIDEVVPGDVIQSYQFWNKLQDGVIALVHSGRWVSYENESTSESVPVLIYTEATESTFWENCGLPYGFRRATGVDQSVNNWTNYNDDCFAYGKMQSGDIIGPWVLVDLQKAISELKRFEIKRIEDGRFAYISLMRYIGTGIFDYPSKTWDDAYALAQTNWDGYSGTNAFPFQGHNITQMRDFFTDGTIRVDIRRGQFEYGISALQSLSDPPGAYAVCPYYEPLAVGFFVNAESNGFVLKYMIMEGEHYADVPFDNFGDSIYRGDEPNWYTLHSAISCDGTEDEYPTSGLYGNSSVINSPSPAWIPFDDMNSRIFYITQGNMTYMGAYIEPVFSYTLPE